MLTRQVETGQVVSSGSGVLFRMARGGEMELMAQMAEADLARVRVGTRATISPVGTNLQIAGQVWQVSPVIDPDTRQGMVRIAVPYSTALRPGGFADARLVSPLLIDHGHYAGLLFIAQPLAGQGLVVRLPTDAHVLASPHNAQPLDELFLEDLPAGFFVMVTPCSRLSTWITASKNCAFSCACFSCTSSSLMRCVRSFPSCGR